MKKIPLYIKIFISVVTVYAFFIVFSLSIPNFKEASPSQYASLKHYLDKPETILYLKEIMKDERVTEREYSKLIKLSVKLTDEKHKKNLKSYKDQIKRAIQ